MEQANGVPGASANGKGNLAPAPIDGHGAWQPCRGAIRAQPLARGPPKCRPCAKYVPPQRPLRARAGWSGRQRCPVPLVRVGEDRDAGAQQAFRATLARLLASLGRPAGWGMVRRGDRATDTTPFAPRGLGG